MAHDDAPGFPGHTRHEAVAVREVQQLRNVQHPFCERGDVATTVRLSERYKHVQPGDKFKLWECSQGHSSECPIVGCRYHGLARVLGSWYGPISKIPPALLKIEHEEEARELDGLKASLARGYNRTIQDSEYVYVIIYERE